MDAHHITDETMIDLLLDKGFNVICDDGEHKHASCVLFYVTKNGAVFRSPNVGKPIEMQVAHLGCDAHHLWSGFSPAEAYYMIGARPVVPLELSNTLWEAAFRLEAEAEEEALWKNAGSRATSPSKT